MRGYENLNYEHNQSLKKKPCCQCPTDKEIIYCGCDCHDVPMNDEN